MYARGQESKGGNCCRKTTKPTSLAYSLQTAACVCNTHFRTSCLWPGVPVPAGMDPGLALMITSVFEVATRVRRSVAATAVAAALLGGCAVNDTGASEVWDPIETPNRFIFAINRTVDVMAIRPLAVTYRDWVPEKAQKSVRNLLDNLGEPVTAINEVFQGDPSRAGTTMARFLVNSTLGQIGRASCRERGLTRGVRGGGERAKVSEAMT